MNSPIDVTENTKFPLGIRIESNGTVFGTSIVDIATGAPLRNVKRIEIEALDADSKESFVCAKVYFHNIALRLDAKEIKLVEVPREG